MSHDQKAAGVEKILFVVQNFTRNKGGAEHNLALVANAMAERGYEVSILSQGRETETPAYKIHPSIRHRIVAEFMYEDSLGDAVQQVSPDVIVYPYFRYDLIAVMNVARISGIPIVVWEPGDAQRKIGLFEGVRFTDMTPADLRSALLTSAQGVRLTRHDLLDTLPAFHHPWCSVLENPFFLGKCYANRPRTQKAIVSVGGLKSDLKRGGDALQAFARLAPAFPDWHLKVLGRVKDAEEMPERLRALGIEGRVELVGVTDDVYGELEYSDIHIITSLSEANPNVIGEAMCNGLPTVGYRDCRGVAAKVREGEDGMLANHSPDLDDLVETLRTLMADDQLRKRLSQNAYRKAESFSPEEVFDAWEALLQRAGRYKGRLSALEAEQKEVDPGTTDHYHAMQRQVFDDWNNR